jgi:hypothetical protein
MRRVDEFSPAVLGFLADAGGQGFLEVEEALLVVLNVHDVFPEIRLTFAPHRDRVFNADARDTLSSDHSSLR